MLHKRSTVFFHSLSLMLFASFPSQFLSIYQSFKAASERLLAGWVILATSGCFIAVLIRLVTRKKITLLLKIQWKQHHILFIKIVNKHNMMRLRVHARRGRGVGVEIKDWLRMWVEIEQVYLKTWLIVE